MTQDADAAPHALVVDDNAVILLDSCMILEDAGYLTLDARTGDDALLLLQEYDGKVQLLFTDVRMPGKLDGFALAREVACRWPAIVIVVTSGEAVPQPGDLPDGATFIGKPFSAQIIYQRLRQLLPEAALTAFLRPPAS